MLAHRIDSQMSLSPGISRRHAVLYDPCALFSSSIFSSLAIGDGAKAGCQAVPASDGNNGQRQVDQFFVGKILAYLGIGLVWHVVNGNQGHCLCPCQSCSLTLGIERSLAPGNEFIETLFGFAARPRGFSMQIDSIRAPVELRRANFDKLDEQRLLAGKIG